MGRAGRGGGGARGTRADCLGADLRRAQAAPDLYVCGPPPLVDSVLEVAQRHALSPERVFRERFLPS
ncbi:MAG: hypothetical protein IRZ08_15055 [Frankia sp.]|nr:hypothetical protein [Frankia sp.]